MRYLFILFIALISLPSLAQKDPQAKVLLDQLGQKVKQSKGILVNIQLSTKNNKGKSMGAKSIKLKMKGDKYLLNEGKMEILCDGISIYNFDGVNSISKSAMGESDQTLSPQKLLSGNYDKEFNFKWESHKGDVDHSIVHTIHVNIEGKDEVSTIYEVTHDFSEYERVFEKVGFTKLDSIVLPERNIYVLHKQV